MAYRRARSTHIITDHLLAGADHGSRLLTAADAETFTVGHALTADADGNIVDSGEIAGGGGGGANPIRDGMALQYDPTPSSSQTEDDEFNSSTLDAKWTVVTNTASSVDIDTTWASHLYVKFTGNQTYTITQSYAPSGDFSITCRFRYAILNNFNICRVFLYNSGETEGIGQDWFANGGTGVTRLASIDSGALNSRGTVTRPIQYSQYVHFQRVSGTWKGFTSDDGISWIFHGSHTKTFTEHHLQVFISQNSATGAFGQAGLDWIRRDYLTL